MSAVEKNHRIRGLNIVWQRDDTTVVGIEGQGRKSPAEIDWIRHARTLIRWGFELYHALFMPVFTFPRRADAYRYQRPVISYAP